MENDKIIESLVSDAMSEKPFVLKLTIQEEREEEQVDVVPFLKIFKKKIKKKVKRECEKIYEYNICPPTLGKLQVLSKYYLALDIDEKSLLKEPIAEAMRICESKINDVCCFMAVATFDKREDLLDDKKIHERADFFKWHASTTHFAEVVLRIISLMNYENFINSIRLAKILRQNEPNKKRRTNRVE